MALLTKFLGFCKNVMTTSSTPMQTMQVEVTNGELKDEAEHYEPFGFTSHPPAGSDGLIAFIGGDRSNAVVICMAGRAGRVTGLAEGDVAIYSQGGAVIKLVGGDIQITGNVTVTGDVIANGISLTKHTHGGVSAGLANTGEPNK